jgi:hypothetical protein
MMIHLRRPPVAKLLSAEWLRIRHYWLTWALAGAWIILLALQVNARISRLEELEAQMAAAPAAGEIAPMDALVLQNERLELEMLQEKLRYPAFIGTAARLATGPGWFLVILFAAVMGGEDFSRRMLHTTLVRGVGRASYLLARCLALWLAVGAGVALITALTAITGFSVHSRVTSDPITFQGLGLALLYVLRAWLTYLPFIAAMLFWTVLGRGAGPAMGVGLGLHFFEYFGGFMYPMMALIIANGGQFPTFFRWELRLLSFSLGYSADVFLNWGSPFLVELGNESLLPTAPWRAVALLAGYSGLSLGLAIWNLHRRDVAYSG